MSAQYCVIGDPIAHSLSPAIYTPLFARHGIDAVYGKVHVRRGELPAFLRLAEEQGYGGFNATMPHKQDLLSLVDELGPSAKLHRSVNTVVRLNKKWVGHSTDGDGFSLNLREQGLTLSGQDVLLLGAGGASSTIALTAMAEDARSLTILNRTESRAEELAGLVEARTGRRCAFGPMDQEAMIRAAEKATLLINSTSLGMEGCAGNYEDFTFLDAFSGSAVCDVIYKPAVTRLIAEAQQRGKQTVGGIGMLIWQGLSAFHLYFGIEPTAEDRAAVQQSLIDAGYLKE